MYKRVKPVKPDMTISANVRASWQFKSLIYELKTICEMAPCVIPAWDIIMGSLRLIISSYHLHLHQHIATLHVIIW